MKLIDADEFLRIERKRCDGEEPIIGTRSMNNIYLRGELDRIPTVDAEPVRHGKWIKGDSDTWNGFTRVRRYRCSLCGEAFNEWLKPRYYCPKCGAKMGED